MLIVCRFYKEQNISMCNAMERCQTHLLVKSKGQEKNVGI